MTQTKVCKRCNRELPIDGFSLIKVRPDTVYRRGFCKECEFKYRRERYRAKKRVKINPDVDILIKREFKEINPERILDASELGDIPLCGEDEIFVKMVNYKNAWLSNYGRCLLRRKGKYRLRKLRINVLGRWFYTLYKNVNENGTFKYKPATVYAAQAVVDMFLVNPDVVNNTWVWHKGDKRDDYYYKNLYPLNTRQYSAVKRYFQNNNDDSEAVIENIMNDIRYKPDTFITVKITPTVCDIGYHGKPGVSSGSLAYRKWNNMILRCYSKNEQKRYSGYKDCTVCKEWHNFSNFEKWFNDNYYKIEGERMDLDKDILFKGNRVYGPSTCCIVPQEINSLISTCKRRGGELPVGVSLNKITNKYQAQITNKQFATPEEAFLCYKEAKEKRIKDVAEKYKGKIPDKLYQAMLNWSIEIDD